MSIVTGIAMKIPIKNDRTPKNAITTENKISAIKSSILCLVIFQEERIALKKSGFSCSIRL